MPRKHRLDDGLKKALGDGATIYEKPLLVIMSIIDHAGNQRTIAGAILGEHDGRFVIAHFRPTGPWNREDRATHPRTAKTRVPA